MPTAFGYRPHISRHTLQSGYPICVAASYNRNGDMRPDAFGVEMDGLRYRYLIKSYTPGRDKPGLLCFNCEYVDFGRIRTVILVFDIHNHCWSIG